MDAALDALDVTDRLLAWRPEEANDRLPPEREPNTAQPSQSIVNSLCASCTLEVEIRVLCVCNSKSRPGCRPRQSSGWRPCKRIILVSSTVRICRKPIPFSVPLLLCATQALQPASNPWLRQTNVSFDEPRAVQLAHRFGHVQSTCILRIKGVRICAKLVELFCRIQLPILASKHERRCSNRVPDVDLDSFTLNQSFHLTRRFEVREEHLVQTFGTTLISFPFMAASCNSVVPSTASS
mmetsp:Transcript_47037/g.94258  ORF Transcript_47037/g.94258 Transcript_47037/m.94258 type:complete len:238 (+) Transcript_47037:254-967(+)